MITSATPTAVPNLAHIRPWGFVGEWVKYNLIFLFIPLNVIADVFHDYNLAFILTFAALELWLL